MSKTFTVHTDAGHPIIFLVHPDPAGGLTARADGHGIFVQGDTMSALQSAAAEAVRVHFAPRDAAPSKAEEAAGIRLAEIAEGWEGKELFWDHHDNWWKKEKIEEAMSIVAAHDAEREPCRWTGKDVGDRFLVWAASCRSPVNLAPGFLPGSDGCRYCHGCGKTIEVTP